MWLPMLLLLLLLLLRVLWVQRQEWNILLL